MSTVPKRLLSPQEYLALERQADVRSEYHHGEIFAMAGASWEHTLIKDNLAREAGNQLKSGPCRVLTSDLHVKVNATGLYTYPNVVIVCDVPQFEDKVMDTLLNPRVVVEVLSDSTEKYDRGVKFAIIDNWRRFRNMCWSLRIGRSWSGTCARRRTNGC